MNTLNNTIDLLKYKKQFFFLLLHTIFTTITVATYHKLITINEAPIAPEWVIYFVIELGVFTALVVVPCVLLMYYLLVLHRYHGTWDIYHVRAIGVVFFLIWLYFIYTQNYPFEMGQDLKTLGETSNTSRIIKKVSQVDDEFDEYDDESDMDN